MSEDILPLAKKIAAELWGKGGDAEYAHGMTDRAYLTLAGSAQRLFILPDWKNRGKLLVTGQYPETDMTTEPHYIRVSPARQPAAIAADISRRLLPGYREELDRVRDYIKQVSAAGFKRADVAALVACALGDAAGRVDDQESHGLTRVGVILPGGYGDVEINHDGSDISLNLRYLPREVALKMLAVLAEPAQSEGPAASGS